MEDYQEIMEEFADEFGEAPTDGEEQRFTIDSDVKAEWAIRKIAEEEAERDRLTAVCQTEIDRYTERKEFYVKRCEGRTANLRAMLLLYFGTVPVKDTKTQQKYELPSGSLVMKKASSDYKPDTDRLREWLEAGKMTDYLKTEVSPKWALVKKQLSTTADGDIVFGETGEIVPKGCVTIEEKPARFEVKAK
ncbi:MAG: host-nuclease inhibitor Gam family protein [Clostridia bacterium]|nr:host-nuclease inhibitor Gam family protein [Clostridia bacterium]MBQ6121535.1 host-nuclease inhibitor Gam family protein [Clostridia bacterium]